MQFLNREPIHRSIKKIGKTLFYASLVFLTNNTIAAEYKLSEYFNAFSETKTLNAQTDGSVILPACVEPNPAWVSGGFNRKFRLVIKKANSAPGFSIRTFYRDVSPHYINSAALPLVVGERYQLTVDYFGKHPGGGGSCLGLSQIRPLGTKTFTYDVHHSLLTFPVDINIHSRKLRHLATNECFLPDLSGATAFDTRIKATPCSSDSKQAFEIIDGGTGNPSEVKIKSQQLRQCISPRVIFSKDGAPVRASSCLDDKRTLFVLDKVKKNGVVIPGQYRLRHKDSNTCLYNYDMTSKAHLWSCWDSPNQIFTLDSY